MACKVSEKTTRYCWPTPKCRKLYLVHAVIDGPGTWESKVATATLSHGNRFANNIRPFRLPMCAPPCPPAILPPGPRWGGPPVQRRSLPLGVSHPRATSQPCQRSAAWPCRHAWGWGSACRRYAASRGSMRWGVAGAPAIATRVLQRQPMERAMGTGTSAEVLPGFTCLVAEVFPEQHASPGA
jgi:hypothetical protein